MYKAIFFYIKLILVSYMMSLLFSCSTSSLVEIITDKQLIVLNARLLAQNSPSVYVGKTWSPTEVFPKESYYRNADVELFENGQSVGKLFFSNGMYVNPNYIIKANTDYIIKAYISTVGSVESEPVHIPSDVTISQISFDTKTTLIPKYSGYTPSFLVEFSFKKNIDKGIYYAVSEIGYNDEQGPFGCYSENLEYDKSTKVKSPCYLKVTTPFINKNGLLRGFSYGYIAYSEECITDSEKKIQLLVQTTGNSISKDIIFPNSFNYAIKQLIIMVTTISSEAIKEQDTTTDVEGLGAILSEPSRTYTNIKGGLGVVSGYNYSYKTLIIK